MRETVTLVDPFQLTIFCDTVRKHAVDLLALHYGQIAFLALRPSESNFFMYCLALFLTEKLGVLEQ